MMKKIFLLLIIFFNLSLVFSIDVEINITESSKVTKLLSGGYLLVADGVLEIKNPSQFSKIYDFNFPFSVDSLIGINKVFLDNSSVKFNFNHNKISGHLIGPNESIKTKYHIYGIISYNIFDKLETSNSTVLDYYIDSYDFSSNTIINLQKPRQEGFVYNLNGTLNSTPTGNSTRLISSIVKNPTDFDYNVREIKLYRTQTSDPDINLGVLIKSFLNLTVAPFSQISIDFFDFFSNDYSVYWISSNINLNYNLFSSSKRSFVIQNSLKSSSSSYFHFKDSLNDSVETSLNNIIFKKTVDKLFVRNGEEFTVYLKIANINNYNLSNLKIYDEIPKNYKLKDVSENVKISSENNLEFKIDNIGGFENKIIKYTLINKEEIQGVTYLKPAELKLENSSIFTDGILLIVDLLPDKKIYVQKKIDYLDDKFAKVTLIVKNLGGIIINDVLVSDDIDENSILKEISKVFLERGVWKIKELRPGEEWEVTYLIERTANLDSIPNIYGVDKSSVFGTLISSEEVITIFQEQPKIIEKVGMGLAVGLLVIYLLF